MREKLYSTAIPSTIVMMLSSSTRNCPMATTPLNRNEHRPSKITSFNSLLIALVVFLNLHSLLSIASAAPVAVAAPPSGVLGTGIRGVNFKVDRNDLSNTRASLSSRRGFKVEEGDDKLFESNSRKKENADIDRGEPKRLPHGRGDDRSRDAGGKSNRKTPKRKGSLLPKYGVERINDPKYISYIHGEMTEDARSHLLIPDHRDGDGQPKITKAKQWRQRFGLGRTMKLPGDVWRTLPEDFGISPAEFYERINLEKWKLELANSGVGRVTVFDVPVKKGNQISSRMLRAMAKQPAPLVTDVHIIPEVQSEDEWKSSKWGYIVDKTGNIIKNRMDG